MALRRDSMHATFDGLLQLGAETRLVAVIVCILFVDTTGASDTVLHENPIYGDRLWEIIRDSEHIAV